MNIPSQKRERLFVFEQVLQAHLVVHDGLQAFDAPDINKNQNKGLKKGFGFLLVLHFVPF